MKLLLDTHSLLWALEDNAKLSPIARAAIVDRENEIFVSAVSAWEIAIKRSNGRLKIASDLDALITQAAFTRRVVGFADAWRVETLPFHHRDPFDRLIVAQAMEDGIPLISCDKDIQRYQVQIVW